MGYWSQNGRYLGDIRKESIGRQIMYLINYHKSI
jgi:hypothetical protein